MPSKSPRRIVLAYDLGGTKVAVGAVDSNGKILEEMRVPVDLEHGKAGLIRQLADLGKQVLSRHKGIRAVGVASAAVASGGAGAAIAAPPVARPTQCSFCPADPTVVCVVGPGTLRFFRIEQAGFKVIQCRMNDYKGSEQFTCHTWIEERTLVCTEQGDIVLLEQAVLRAVLENPSEGHAIRSIAAFANGLVAGCAEGHVYVFERADKVEDRRSYYRRSKALRIDAVAAAAITNLALSPNEESLLLASDSNQLFTLPLTNVDMVKQEDMRFEPLAQSFHHGAIIGLDLCMRKPLLVTCGIDHTVRVWNYLDKTVELMQSFNEEPLSVAFHPSGLHIIVGFADKLRLMNLLVDSMRTFKELPIKACREVQFSNGGQYFACANLNSISIFNFYTCENVQNLRAHNQRIRSLYWSLDDTQLISAGADGAVFEWRVKDAWRPQEYVQKGTVFYSALATADGHIYVCGSDRMLKEVTDSNPTKELDAGVALTQVLLSHPPQRMMFASTESGLIRSFGFPLSGEWADVPCHSAPVTRLRISQNDAYLFSAGDDGCLAIFDIREREASKARRKPELAVPWAEEVLVTKSDLEEKQQTMVELQAKVDELTLQNEYQLRLKDMNYQERIKEITDKFQTELMESKTHFERLKEEKQEAELEYEERVKRIEDDHNLNVADMESAHSKKLTDEMERYRELERVLRATQEAWEQRMRADDERHAAELDAIQEEAETRLDDRRTEREQLEEQRSLRQQEFTETRTQIEDDADREIEELKERYDARLKLQREATLRLKGENGIMKKKFSALKKDIEDQKEELKAMGEKQLQLLNHIRELNKEIEGYRQEIAERDLTIGEKEKRIYDLKKRNQELEKWKFVLDYRIKDLKRQIEPREKDIARMRGEIKEKDEQLETFHQQNAELQLTVAAQRARLQEAQDEIGQQRQRFRELEGRLAYFRGDLQEAAQLIQQPLRLLAAVHELYRKYVTALQRSAEVDPEVAKEYQRQRQYLERTVEALRRKLERDSEANQHENLRVMQENVALVKEINELRKEIRNIKQAQRERELAGSLAPTKPGSRGGHVGDAGAGTIGGGLNSAVAAMEEEAAAARELQRQRERIGELQAQIEAMHQPRQMSRPMSREVLPPIH
jgi:WD40 repeat protein